MTLTESPSQPKALGTDHACDMLRELLAAIPGARISVSIPQLLGDTVFHVRMDAADEGAEDAVYRAELEVYRRFPNARFELYVL